MMSSEMRLFEDLLGDHDDDDNGVWYPLGAGEEEVKCATPGTSEQVVYRGGPSPLGQIPTREPPPVCEPPPKLSPVSSSSPLLPNCVQLPNGQLMVQAQLQQVHTSNGEMVTVAVMPNFSRISGIMDSSRTFHLAGEPSTSQSESIVTSSNARTGQQQQMQASTSAYVQVCSSSQLTHAPPPHQTHAISPCESSPRDASSSTKPKRNRSIQPRSSNRVKKVTKPLSNPAANQPVACFLSKEDNDAVLQLSRSLTQLQHEQRMGRDHSISITQLEERIKQIFSRAAQLSSPAPTPTPVRSKPVAVTPSRVMFESPGPSNGPKATLLCESRVVTGDYGATSMYFGSQRTTNLRDATQMRIEVVPIANVVSREVTKRRIATPAEIAAALSARRTKRSARLRSYFDDLRQSIPSSDTLTPFADVSDALSRLLPFCSFYEPDLNPQFFDAFDHDYKRKLVNIQQRFKRAHTRFRSSLFRAAIEPDEVRNEKCLLTFLEMEYEKRLLDEDRAFAQRDRAGFVAASPICSSHSTQPSGSPLPPPFHVPLLPFEYRPFAESQYKMPSPIPPSCDEESNSASPELNCPGVRLRSDDEQSVKREEDEMDEQVGARETINTNDDDQNIGEMEDVKAEPVRIRIPRGFLEEGVKARHKRKKHKKHKRHSPQPPTANGYATESPAEPQRLLMRIPRAAVVDRKVPVLRIRLNAPTVDVEETPDAAENRNDRPEEDNLGSDPGSAVHFSPDSGDNDSDNERLRNVTDGLLSRLDSWTDRRVEPRVWQASTWQDAFTTSWPDPSTSTSWPARPSPATGASLPWPGAISGLEDSD